MKTGPCRECNWWTPMLTVEDGIGSEVGQCEKMATYMIPVDACGAFHGLTPSYGTCSLFVPLNVGTRRVDE